MHEAVADSLSSLLRSAEALPLPFLPSPRRLAMAVIRDLPPELIYRILSLACETDQPGGCSPTLLAASRVAQAWTAPAQALLPLDVDLQQSYDHVTGYVAALERLGRRPIIHRLALHGTLYELGSTVYGTAQTRPLVTNFHHVQSNSNVLCTFLKASATSRRAFFRARVQVYGVHRSISPYRTVHTGTRAPCTGVYRVRCRTPVEPSYETRETIEKIADQVAGVDQLCFPGHESLDVEMVTVEFLHRALSCSNLSRPLLTAPTSPGLQVKSLTIERQLHDPFRVETSKPHHVAELPLVHLSLNHRSIIPVALLAPLVTSAINLTHLSVAWTLEARYPFFFRSDSIDAWVKLAPQLRKLDLIYRPLFDSDHVLEATASLRFLSACTALETFTLSLDPDDNDRLADFLEHVPGKLIVLRTSSDFVRHRPFEFARDSLRRALGSSALVELQRWELLDPTELDKLGAGGKWWRDECAERGIEILDGRHSIPGKPLHLQTSPKDLKAKFFFFFFTQTFPESGERSVTERRSAASVLAESTEPH
uniref:F-box domain-containing protein n=1 Tax=Leucosporidium scottii TaxID=5278 RepID=A0A0H5FTJ2_9BASI|nr:hypothetical protein [Leucosporidium scottii]